MSLQTLLLVVLAATCSAFRAAAPVIAPRASVISQRQTAPLMNAAVEGATNLLPALSASTVVVADIIDQVAAFADSPFILILPIGGGALVASLIILILVKSAG